MALFIEIKAADGLVSRTILDAGRNRFTVRLGDSYRIFDDATGLTPEGVAVKRIDNDLLVDGLGVAGTTVEFTEFYSVCSAGSPCDLTVDTGTGGAPVAITPGTQPIGALADGSFVLYDPRFAETAPSAPATGDGAMVRNVLYGVGGLAVVGLAAGGGGGGGDGGGGDGTLPDGALSLTSSPFVNTRTPTLTGEAEAGSRVLVRIDTDGDGTPNVTYATTVGADSRWSVNLAAATPESGSLPAGGLPDSSIVGITSTTDAGVASVPPFTLAFDGVPPGPAVLNAVATDNVVNAAEKQNGVVISGMAEAGSTVVLSLGAQVLASVAVQQDGQWQTETLSSASLPGDGAYVLSAVVQDRAGNLSPATEASLSINTAPPLFTALSVAGGDNQVAIADASTVGFSGRTDPNAAVLVQWNGGDKPVTADGSGNWSIAYTGAEVPDSGGASFPYTITATNVIGNSLVQTGAVDVDRVAPAAPVIAAVEGDNLVTVAERSDGVTVGGQGEAGARVQVSWGNSTRVTSVDSNGQWGVQFAPGDLPQVASPGGPTTISAILTDSVGNSASSQLTVRLEQPFAAPAIGLVEGDDVVTFLEASDGVLLSGSAPAGAAGVNVTWGGFQGLAGISGATWSLFVPAEGVPPDGLTSVTATIAGAGGGAAATPRSVTVDKTPPAPPLVDLVTGDDFISQIDQLIDVVVSGQAEAGARVSVTLGAAAPRETSAGANGVWDVSFAPAEIPDVQTVIPLSVTAFDAVGNASTATARDITVEGAPAPVIPLPEVLLPDSSAVFFPPATTTPDSPAGTNTGVAGLTSPGASLNYDGSTSAVSSLLSEETSSTGRIA